MKIENNVISFEVSEDMLNLFKLAMLSLEADADKEFASWIQTMAGRAMRNIERRQDRTIFMTSEENNDLIKSRIERWSQRPDSGIFMVIKSYFLLSNECNDEYVPRSSMLNKFLSLSVENSQIRFISTLRGLCSDSVRAYGKIFEYDQNKEVISLNSTYKTFLLQYKESFLKENN